MSNLLYSFSATCSIGRFSAHLLSKFVSRYIVYASNSLEKFLLDIYAISFPNDRRWLKCLVYGVFVFEMTQTLLVAHDMFATFASGWGDLSQLANAHLAWLNAPIMSGMGEVQCCYSLLLRWLTGAHS